MGVGLHLNISLGKVLTCQSRISGFPLKRLWQ